MEDGFVDFTDLHGTMLCSCREKCDETLGHDIRLSVDPQLNFSAQVVDVVRVGADEAERFGKRVAVLFYRPSSPLLSVQLPGQNHAVSM